MVPRINGLQLSSLHKQRRNGSGIDTEIVLKPLWNNVFIRGARTTHAPNECYPTEQTNLSRSRHDLTLQF